MQQRKIGFELYHSSRLVKRYMDGDAAKNYLEKMTGTHARAIGYFYNNRDKDIFQKDFEQEFDVRRSTASSILSLMEKNGLITRQGVPYDGRLKKITLTEKARDIQQVVEEGFERLESIMKKDITPQELEIFFGVLDKINSNLEQRSKEND